MIISEYKNTLNTNKTSFKGKSAETSSSKPETKGSTETLYDRYVKTVNDHKEARKKGADEKVFLDIKKRFDDIAKEAKETIGTVKIPKGFETIVKYLGKVKIEKTGNKTIDTATQLTKLVLWGNVGKEVVGTILYTVQALTNEDLPPDKRKFVGMYDLSVGVVSTIFSFIFGVGLQDSILKGYKKLLKPLSEAPNAAIRSKTAAAIVGLSAFSSFFLQTIIGKRVVAPGIGTPAAAKLRTIMEKREAKNNEPDKQEKSKKS